jgi:hypothetical protein
VAGAGSVVDRWRGGGGEVRGRHGALGWVGNVGGVRASVGRRQGSASGPSGRVVMFRQPGLIGAHMSGHRHQRR